MGHIFISYKSEEVARANVVRLCLEKAGFEVWWDKNLQTGSQWSQVLDTKLKTASGVVVLWSEASTASEWVRHEASGAKMRGVLAHAKLENVEIPELYSSVQFSNLANWNGLETDHEFLKIVHALNEMRAKEQREVAARNDEINALSSQWQKVRNIGTATVIVAGMFGGALGAYAGWTFVTAATPDREGGSVIQIVPDDPRPNIPGPPAPSEQRTMLASYEKDERAKVEGLVTEFIQARRLFEPSNSVVGKYLNARTFLDNGSKILTTEDTVELRLQIEGALESFAAQYEIGPLRFVDEHPNRLQLSTAITALIRDPLAPVNYEDAIYSFKPDLPSLVILRELRFQRPDSEKLDLISMLSYSTNPTWSLQPLEALLVDRTGYPNAQAVQIARRVLGTEFDAWYYHVRGGRTYEEDLNRPSDK